MTRYRQSGPIRFGEVVEYFGGTDGNPYDISNYYKGGGVVPATGPNGGQAAVHSIAVADGASSSPNTGVNEAFDIALTGWSGTGDTFPTSNTFSGSFPYTPGIGGTNTLGTVTYTNTEQTAFNITGFDFSLNTYPSGATAPLEFTRSYDTGRIGLQSDQIHWDTFNTDWDSLRIIDLGLTSTEESDLATFLGLTSITTSSQTVQRRFAVITNGTGNIGYFQFSTVSKFNVTDDYVRVGLNPITFPVYTNEGAPTTTNGDSVGIEIHTDADGRDSKVFAIRFGSGVGEAFTTVETPIIRVGNNSIRQLVGNPFLITGLGRISIPAGGTGEVTYRFIVFTTNEAITISDVTILTESVGPPSNVVIDIPTDSISESIRLTPGSVSENELREALFNIASANTNITNNWSLSRETRMITQSDYQRMDTITFAGSRSGTPLLRSDDDLTQNTIFNTAGNRFLSIGSTSYNIYETTGSVEVDPVFADGWLVGATEIDESTHLNIGVFPPNDIRFIIYTSPQDSMVEIPVVRFTALNQLDHTVMVAFQNGSGKIDSFFTLPTAPALNPISIRDSELALVVDGAAGSISSEISLDFGTGVDPRTEMIILGEQDRQGIADVIANEVNMHSQLYSTSLPNAARIEDSRQRERVSPIITVPVAGTSALAASDFTVTEIQAGIPTALTTDYPTIEYSTGDIAATTIGWNFHSSITGPMTTFSTWPTTGEVFLHVGLADVVLDDIEATLGLAEITQTMQDVTPDATLTFAFRFLDLVDATSTYQITGVRLVSTSTGTALGVRLDGTTGVQSIANTDPIFENEQVVGLNFFRRQMGPVNDTIPPEGLTGTSDYSTDQNLADGTFGFFDGGTSGSNNIELTEWPTTGIIYLRSQDEFNLATIRDVLGLSGFPSLTPLAVTHSTHLTISDGAGNEATYRVTMASIVSIGRLDELCLELDATTLSRESGTPAYTAGDTLTITFANPLDFTDFYNANDGSNT